MDRNTGAGKPRRPVSLLDLAAQVPALLLDTPVILRGALTGLLSLPVSKISIGKIFQDRAGQYPDRIFIRFGDEEITYRQANETVNRYAAVLAGHGVGHGDVVGIMLSNRPETVLVMLAAVKCGAVAGMLNFNQRADVLAHSIGLLDSTVLIAEADLITPITESGARPATLITIDTLAKKSAGMPADNPPSAAEVRARDTAFYIFTSGTTGNPKASVMTHQRWLRALAGFSGLGVRLRGGDTMYCALPLYHNNALTVALSSVIDAGATLALGRSFSASRFWDEVIAAKATAFIYIGELCRYLLNQPPRPTDRSHHVRVIVGNGLRPDIWEAFTERFGIKRVVVFYAASVGNTAFINIFNIPGSTGINPLPLAYVEYDTATGEPVRDSNGRVRRVPAGQPGLLISPVSRLSPFDGYTDKAASEKKLVRNAFKDGDVWFNTGDVMCPQGMGHAAFADRIGDTFRWKGENVATTDVEAALSADAGVQECTVFGVEVPGTDGRAGMAAVKLRAGVVFDGPELAAQLYRTLPAYSVPLFIRLVESLETTSTFKSRKVDLRDEAFGPDVSDPLYVLAGRDDGYVAFYDGYPAEVAAGKRPRG
ncbi:MAG: long-chain-acyl-CoA synthetase FadD6 [Mycobacterium sp.]